MENINFRKTLIEIAKEEGSSQIAKVIAFFYPRLKLDSREAFFESLMNLYQLSENTDLNFEELEKILEIKINDPYVYINKDFRIKSIEISSLRGVPSKIENNGIPYGINFINSKGILNNAIILANNGTGKSSIFAGLEMIFANEIGEKNLRSKSSNSLKLKDYNSYLERFQSDEKPNCTIETFQGKYSLENKIFTDELIRIFNPKSHFITEFDIIENGRIDFSNTVNYDYSFHNIIAKNLGLNEYLDFVKICEQIPNYARRKETTNRNNIQSEININNETIKNRKVLIQSKTIELYDIKKGTKLHIEQANLVENLEILRKILSVNIDIRYIKEEYISTINKYNSSFSKYLSLNKNTQ